MSGLSDLELEKAYLDYEKSFDVPKSVADVDFGSKVLEHDLKSEPDAESQWGHIKCESGEYRLVGHGSVTDPKSCGKFFGFMGCVRTDLHKLISLDGVNYSGKVYVKIVHKFCSRPSCPVCYRNGFAKRSAWSITGRLAEGSKRFGKVEHVILGIPEKDYGLSFESLRHKAVGVLKKRGVIGGCLIFHAFRYRSDAVRLRSGVRLLAGWYWSPHWHCLGFIAGGFGKCRSCSQGSLACMSCDGFNGRTRRCFEKDGYIAKVKGERITVAGTAWYQLTHASYKVDSVRFHVSSWFGTMSYRKLKVTPEERHALCPICQHELERVRYFGNKSFIVDRDDPNFCGEFFADMNEGMGDVWCVAGKHDFG